jgi:HSP20 family protein
MGRLIESLDPLQPWRLARPFPPINLYDTGDRYVVTAQLPGVAPEDVELAITGETLTLRGERKRAAGVADESFRRQERVFGRWARSITLPDRVESTQVAASFAHGVLTISVPKSASAKPRQITISAGT